MSCKIQTNKKSGLYLMFVADIEITWKTFLVFDLN